MTLFRNVVFVAALAGLVAGLAMAAMQTFVTVPLILEAETYEGGAAEAAHGHDGAAAGHGHGDGAWAPADGGERLAFTALASVVTATGFALVLLVASELAGGLAGWRQGLFWGLAGFAVFTLAPGLGLPPELPGMPAAALPARQGWWIATAAATAAGLALIAFRGSVAMAVLGVALIVAPHVVGAPQPDSHASAVPDELHRRFIVAASLTSLVFWVVLGAAAGALRGRFARAAEPGATLG